MKKIIELPKSALGDLFIVPDYYLTEFAGRHAHFVRMTRDTYHRSIFTDSHRVVAADENIYRIEIPVLMKLYEDYQNNGLAINYIFHVAHCGSTLVSRSVDLLEKNLVYREPGPLRQLAADYARSGNQISLDSTWGRGLRMVCALLGRRYKDKQSVIVKANVPVNFILPELLELNPDSRALFIYSRLQDFMVAALKSPERRLWVARLLKELAGSVSIATGTPIKALEELTPGAGAACLWQAQVRRFVDMLDSRDNTRSLDSETFFDNPDKGLKSILDWFCQEYTNAEISGIVGGNLFTSHAKAPRINYDNSRRKAERNNLLHELESEIKEGMAWLKKHYSNHQSTSTLPSPLGGNHS